jgi:predicted transcriptional regulator
MAKLSENLIVRVYPELLVGLSRVAQLDDRTPSYIVRKAIEREIARHGLTPEPARPVAASSDQERKVG